MDSISQSRGDINQFNLPVKGPAKYSGIDKNGKASLEINSHGKFASRKVKKLKSAFDKIDRFFHLKNKTFVKRKLNERKVQKELTKSRAAILNNNALPPKDAVKSLYELTQRSEDAGVKKGRLGKLIDQDVSTLLTHQISNATNTKDLEAAYDGFYENINSMPNNMRERLEGQITKRLKNMNSRLGEHLNSFSAHTDNPIQHYALTRSKCTLISSILKLAEKIKQPTKNDSNLVSKYKEPLRKHMHEVINKDLKDITSKLDLDSADTIRSLLNIDFGYESSDQERTFDDFFKIGSNKSDNEVPDSLKKIREDIKNLLKSFPNQI